MGLRDAEPLRDEPTALERLFTTLGRPQYVVGSLLTGEVQDAAENALRFGEELLTGSWLHGYHATNLLPGDWGRDDPNERPGGADVLRRFGAHIDRHSWSEMAADVGVGALLDPLTYVGGIGLGSKVGRVAKGAITGLGAVGEVGLAARSTLERALRATPEGLAALERAGSADNLILGAIHAADAQPVIRKVLAEHSVQVANDPALRAEALARYANGPGPWERGPTGLWQQVGERVGDPQFAQTIQPRFGPALTEEQSAQAFREAAAKRIGLDLGDGRVSLIGTNAQEELLDAGIRGLEGQRLLKPAGVPTIDIPGLSWHALPGGAEQWAKIGLSTPAHALQGLIGVASPATAEAVGKIAADAVEKLRVTFVDRLARTGVPDALQSVAASLAGKIAKANVDDLERVSAHLGQMPNETRSAIGRILLTEDDLMRKGVTKEQAATAERALGIDPTSVVSDATGAATNPEVLARRDAVYGSLPWLGKGEEADRMRAAWAHTREKVRAVGGDEGVAAVDAYVDDVMKMPQQYVDAGVWAKAEASPFYLPHQASDALSLFLSAGPASKRVGTGGQTYAEALRDAFSKAREHANVAETLASFRRVAERYGVPVPDLADFTERYGAELTNHEAAAASGLFNTDIGQLWLRRLWARNGTIGRAEFEKTARATMTDLRHATVLDQFLDASLRGVGARDTVIGKLLGGGDFRAAEGTGAGIALKALGGKRAAVGGQAGYVYHFPGINAFVKPALYLPAVATYTRNALGGVVMGAMDPEIGLGGASGLLSVLRDLPIVRALTGGPARDLQAAMVAVARGREPGMSLVGRTVGGHSAEEVVQHLRAGVLGHNAVTDQEVMGHVGSIADFVEERQRQGRGGWEATKADITAAFTGKGLTSEGTGPRAIERYRRFWAPAGRLNQAIEDGLRSGAYFKLIANGYDPATAAKRVRDTFVDYTYQSGSERLLRDALPFVRFTLGAGPKAIEGATGGLGRAIGRLAVGADDERPLPNEIRRQVSIPIPGMPDTYATSLGLPLEAGGALLGLVPGAQGWYRNTEQNVLGALSPQPKAILEGVTGKQFYSDLPLSDVKPVANLPPFASHALFGFLPLSRFWGETQKFVDAVHGDTRQAVNFLTGVKLRTVDSEREAEAVLKRWLEGAVERGDVQSMTRFFAGKGDEVKPEVRAALEALAARERARRSKAR